MDTQSASVTDLVAQLAAALEARGWMMATAESCTGGLIAAACTERAGSSVWFDRGFVTYSNAAKTAMLGVPAELIVAHGAVSEPVACAMAEGAVRMAGVDLAVAVTGVAGPTGGSADKPVGTVWFGWARKGQPAQAVRCVFDGDRAAVRQATVLRALQGLLASLA